MNFFWKGNLSEAAFLIRNSGKRALYFYGITIGQFGFGFVVSLKRFPSTGTTPKAEAE